MFKVTKILDPSITVQFNVKNKQEIQISTCPSKCCCHGNIRPHNQNSTTSPNCQENLRKIFMIWKDYLKLSEIASYSKLALESKAPPPLPPGGIGLRTFSLSPKLRGSYKRVCMNCLVQLNRAELCFQRDSQLLPLVRLLLLHPWAAQTREFPDPTRDVL